MSNPRNNLNDKFTNLQQQLTLQHNEVITALNSIATTLGAPPPTATTTLADIASILNMIHADTISMDQKLLRMRNAIVPVDAELSSTNNLYHFLELLVISMFGNNDAAETAFPPALSTLDYMRRSYDQVLGMTQDAPESMLYYLYQIFLGLGAPLGGLTIAELLFQTSTNTRLLFSSQTPALDQCTDEYTSDGMFFVPIGVFGAFGQMNLISPVWSHPPTGLQYGTASAGIQSNTILQPANGATWNGWHIFVESDASNFARNGADFARYPTNKWLLVGTDSAPLIVLVPGTSNVVVHLCSPGNLFTDGGGGGGPVGNPVVCTNYGSVKIQGNYWISDFPGGVQRLNGDFYGHTIKLVDYPPTGTPNCYLWDANGGMITSFGLSNNDQTINYHCAQLSVGGEQFYGVQQFTIRICTPSGV